ncbi:MAG TPA: divergent polysaccharide deacetylase family protein, partial [Thermoanaerobaculia bacterium]|nr:divergent polysaccharide deacetylase family protein [Thermoanaerobaculia bacterium]
AAPAPAEGGRVALVIDDLGRSLDDLHALEGLNVPISYAVLPFEEQTPAVVAELRQRGEEILLHLPMEPAGAANDPGPGALRLGMTPEQLRQSTLAALQAVPGASGVNNHMGSGLSADEPSMTTILGVLSSRGLFFLDSRTSAQSVAYRVATRLGLPAAERQVFLDPDPSPEAIRAQFHRLLGLARTRGAAVAIGHPLPETLAILEEEIPKARALGYEFVPVSYLLDRPDAPEEPDE